MHYIQDELHAEQVGEFFSFEQAMAELRRRAGLPWDQPPNAAPCTSWRTCGRNYEIIEWDEAQQRELRRVPVLSVSAEGIAWSSGFAPLSPEPPSA